jgi:iron complex transport system ATP-binding protein
METIQLKNLSIGYRIKRGKTKTLMTSLNASIYSGQLTCLIGANGVGKSTLLRTISSFQPVIDGKILLNGNDISTLSIQQLSKLISVVLTDKIDVQNITVNDLVGLGRSPYTGFWGTLSKHDQEIVDSALQMVGIISMKDASIHTLSDGEKQKVMIAKALAQETPIIILDEPTAFLDYPSKVDVMQLLKRLAHELGKTIFLSTHDLELTLQIADMIWFLDSSHGLITGTAQELTNQGYIPKFMKLDR